MGIHFNIMYNMQPDTHTNIWGKKCIVYTHVYGRW